MGKKVKKLKKIENFPLPEEVIKLHADSVARGLTYYKDPFTGLTVFTELFHKKRGSCCDSDCRHCPYK